MERNKQENSCGLLLNELSDSYASLNESCKKVAVPTVSQNTAAEKLKFSNHDYFCKALSQTRTIKAAFSI